jgi:hypothetical protein
MDAEALRTSFRLQSGLCRHYDSPFYADLLAAAGAEVGTGGPLDRLLADWEGDPLRDFLPLRLLGAVHERVLAGEAPELAGFYPSAGGRVRMPEAWQAFREVLDRQRDVLRPRLDLWPQTNEVRRCGTLLGGFLWSARRLGRPLHLREFGASAGLHLLWDRYGYELGPYRWGDPGTGLRLRVDWEGPPPPLQVPVVVASRAGCDLAPVRLDAPGERRRLEGFVWADQPERLTELRAAVALARREPPRLERASAADWLERELAELDADEAAVVFHSAVWIYLAAEERRRVREALEQRAARGPLVWMGLEHREDTAQVQLRARIWPPGEEVTLADGHPHGRRARWLAAD